MSKFFLKPPKFLIIAPTWIGDLIIAQSLFRFLKNKYPQSLIAVVASLANRGLLENMSEVDTIYEAPVGPGSLGLNKRWALGKVLRKEKFDQAFILPNSWKSALIPFAAHIRKRTGFFGEFRVGLLNDLHFSFKRKSPLLINRFLSLIYPPAANRGFKGWENYRPQLLPHAERQKRSLEKFTLSLEPQPILALCPGAEFGPTKRWPIEHFIEIAKKKLADGWQVWLFGSPKEKALGEAIQQLTFNQCKNLIGHTSLSEAIDLLALSNIVISNDSGLMHMAAALDRPLIALFGSTSPESTPPLSPKAHILTLSLKCSPCFQRECPLGHLDCLKKLEPEKVLSVLANLTLASDNFSTVPRLLKKN